MANVAKGWGVGDTVYVHYQLPSTLYFTPQARTVSKVDVTSSGNEALVQFSDGDSVIDGATVTVYTTQTLCATGIIAAVITASAATAALDSTTSVVSTAGNTSTTLGLIG